MKRRTLFIGIGAVIVLALIGAIIYFVFFAPKTPGIQVGTGQNPFGDAGQATTGGEGTGTNTEGAVQEVAPHLVKITEGPVAYGSLARTLIKKTTIPAQGTSTATTTVTATTTEVRYVERVTGNVYAYDSALATLTRLTNRTLPGIERASFSQDGGTVVLQFLDPETDTIQSYALPVANDAGGYLLEQNLSQAFVAGSSTLITASPSSSGIIVTSAKLDGTNAKTLFSSVLSAITVLPSTKEYFAYTKPASSVDGYGFTVSGNTFTRVLGPLRGLTLLPSPSGKSVIYSALSGNALKGNVMDVATHTVTPLPLAIAPEKCVWTASETAVYCAVPRSIGGIWPDAWYQGRISLSDRIWKIDLASRTASLVVDPDQVAQVQVDAVSLTIDPQSDLLVFTNRNDGSLWAYDL